MKSELLIEGMSCDHCKKRVEEALKSVEGVTDAVVELSEKKAYVTMEKEVSMKEFGEVIDEAGYELINQ